MEMLPANLKVMYFFQYLFEIVQAELSKDAESFTPTEIDLFINLGSPMRMSQLAQAIFCLPSNVTVLVNRLENAGFLERIRSTRDRRAIEVALTDEGARIRKKVIDRIQQVIDEKSLLGADDFQKILGMIHKKESELSV